MINGHAHAEIRTRVVMICGRTRYQLDYGGSPYRLVAFHGVHLIRSYLHGSIMTFVYVSFLIRYDTKVFLRRLRKPGLGQSF